MFDDPITNEARHLGWNDALESNPAYLPRTTFGMGGKIRRRIGEI
jgi:hypothetical protein